MSRDLEDSEATIHIQEQRILKLQQEAHSATRPKITKSTVQNVKRELKTTKPQSRIPAKIDVPRRGQLGKDVNQDTAEKTLGSDTACRSPSPIVNDSTCIPYYGGRWTADRADYRKVCQLV